MSLFHYTHVRHYLQIVVDGKITTTESNIGSGIPGLLPYGEHIEPDVVWLTDRDEPIRCGVDVQPVATPVVYDKTRVRLTVDVPAVEVHHWPAWSRRHRMNPKWRRRLEANMSPSRWYVVEATHPVLGDRRCGSGV